MTASPTSSGRPHQPGHVAQRRESARAARVWNGYGYGSGYGNGYGYVYCGITVGEEGQEEAQAPQAMTAQEGVMGRGKRCSRRRPRPPAIFNEHYFWKKKKTPTIGCAELPGGGDHHSLFIQVYAYGRKHSPFDSCCTLRAGRTPQQKPIRSNGAPSEGLRMKAEPITLWKLVFACVVALKL
jgi:hypothetical protein